MLYEIFNSLKEAHGQDYFSLHVSIDYSKYEINKEDKKLNRQLYEVK